MNNYYLKFESKEQYESALGESEWPIETSFIFPVITEETGETLTDDEGDEYPEVVRKDGFFINTLGEYPESLKEFEVTVDNPQYKWA